MGIFAARGFHSEREKQAIELINRRCKSQQEWRQKRSSEDQEYTAQGKLSQLQCADMAEEVGCRCGTRLSESR